MDIYDLWQLHDDEQERQLKELPVCDYCCEPVQDEYYYQIDDEVICARCMNEQFRKVTEDYVG